MRVRRAHSGSRRVLLLSVIILGLQLLPRVALAAPPVNDAFADAVVASDPLPFTDSVSTTEATLEPGEPRLGDVCGFGVRHTVWYQYTPAADTVLSANTFGSNFDTVLGVWSGTDLASLSQVACNDDTENFQSSVVFVAEMGTQYNFQIGGFAGDSGMLDVAIREIDVVGVIEGTVTDDDTSLPLANICVSAYDADFGQFAGGALTLADGTYQLPTRPGSYLLRFDDCFTETYISEWWDDVARRSDATPISVFNGSLISGIDAALVAGCPGFASSGNQVVGTSGPDTLTGTPRQDVICGFGGDDVLLGGGGRDYLVGGVGADVLRGGDRRDVILAFGGDDSLFGGEGNDFLNGGDGNDVCRGGAGNDSARRCEEEHTIP